MWPTGSWSPRACVLSLLMAPLVTIGLLTGCGTSSDRVAHLTGEVTLDGQPLSEQASASITFRPVGEAGQPVSAQIVQGRYDCPNVPRGTVLAVFSISVPTGRTLQGDLRTGEGNREFKSVALSPDQSVGIELEVTDDDTVNFELISDKK